MAALLILNLARRSMKKTYSTEKAAKRMGVSFRTLNRWLNIGKIKPTMPGIPFSDGRMLWRWSETDIAKGRKIKAAQKPGPKPNPKRRKKWESLSMRESRRYIAKTPRCSFGNCENIVGAEAGRSSASTSILESAARRNTGRNWIFC